MIEYYIPESRIITKVGRKFIVITWNEELYTHVHVKELMCNEYRVAYNSDERGIAQTGLAEKAVDELISRYPNV